MTQEPNFRRLSGADALIVLDELADVYMAAYANDPDIGRSIYARDAFIERTAGQAKSDGFLLVAVYCSNRLVGFSFGLPFLRGRWWRGDSNTAAPPNLLNVDKFAVIELVVLFDFQGRGLASRLMRELLADRPEPYAILLADQEGHAQSIYKRWRWKSVQRLRPSPDVPALDVLALELPD